MALNLVRNSRVFFTTNVEPTTGVIKNNTAFTATNTFEIQVLDGFTFSQNTNQDTVTISEAGDSPVRGQRSFNTSLAPVDFSFSTYIRPGTTSNKVTAEESVLWNALLSAKSIDTTGVALGGSPVAAYSFANNTGTLSLTAISIPSTTSFTKGDVVIISGLSHATADIEKALNSAAVVRDVTVVSQNQTAITLDYINTPSTGTISSITASATTTKLFSNAGWAQVNLPTAGKEIALATAGGSEKNQMQTFGMLFLVDKVLYGIDNAAMGQVSLDFGLDSIATAAWTGQATAIRNLADDITASTTGFTAVTTSLGAGSIATSTGSGSTWSTVITVTTPVTSNIATGNSVAVSGGNSTLGAGPTITAIAYNASNQVTTITVSSTTAATSGAVTGAITVTTLPAGAFTAKNTSAGYLTNKLSTVSLKTVNALKNSAGNTVATSGAGYALALTGGNVTINNNISYITPANLGVVNTPVKYYTGTRAISGSLNAYLKTGIGQGGTGQLLTDMLAASAVTTEPMFALSLSIGGKNDASVRVDLDMPSVVLSIPTIDVQQVVSTAINFTAQGSTATSSTAAAYELSQTNDLTVRYYAV